MDSFSTGMETPSTTQWTESPPTGTFDMAGLINTLNGAWAASSREHSEALRDLGAMLQHAPTTSGPRSGGPKPKEPHTYDGDRSDGKLDDHVRDLENWVRFHERRNHWGDEAEKVEQAATYLTGKMHRMFDLSKDNIHTFPEYVSWLRATFRDNNENAKLKEDWRRCIMGRRSVMEYATDLLYLAARIEPRKLDSEVKEHFRSGLSARLQIRLAEHPEWEELGLNDYIGRTDTLSQIEIAKDRVRLELGPGIKDELYGISELVTTSDKGNELYLINNPRRGPGPFGVNPASLRKGTQEWQNWCRTNRACFNCGKPGHTTRDCLQPRETGCGELQKPPPRFRSKSVPAGRKVPSRFRRSVPYTTVKGRA